LNLNFVEFLGKTKLINEMTKEKKRKTNQILSNAKEKRFHFFEENL